jgi:hypothetical protein
MCDCRNTRMSREYCLLYSVLYAQVLYRILKNMFQKLDVHPSSSDGVGDFVQ